MRVYITADLEGISGIVDADECITGKPGYDRARRLQMGDVNAAIAGAFDGGATEVVVNDSHGRMQNLILEDMDPRAELITGSDKPFFMVQGLDSSFDAAFFIGYHTMAGTPGILNHTYRGNLIFDVKLNGIKAGESEINAAVAGHLGVPVVLITGDSLLAEEVKSSVNPPQFVITKYPSSRTNARCIHPNTVHDRIKQAAKTALEQLDRTRLYKIESPVTLEVGFWRPNMAQAAAVLPGARQVDPRTTVYEAKDIIEAYKALRVFLAMAG